MSLWEGGTKLNKVWIDQRRRSLKAWSSPRTGVETGGQNSRRGEPPVPLQQAQSWQKPQTKGNGRHPYPCLCTASENNVAWVPRFFPPSWAVLFSVLWCTWIFPTRWDWKKLTILDILFCFVFQHNTQKVPIGSILVLNTGKIWRAMLSDLEIDVPMVKDYFLPCT